MKTTIPPLMVMALVLTPLAGIAQSPDAPPHQNAESRFRLLFNAYDGSPNKPNEMSFQINTLDLRQPTEFLKIGDMIPKTRLKLVAFELKRLPNPKTGEMDDVSELKVANVDSGTETVLVLTKVINIPDSAK